MLKAKKSEAQKDGQNAGNTDVRSLCRRCHFRITPSTFPVLRHRNLRRRCSS